MKFACGLLGCVLVTVAVFGGIGVRAEGDDKSSTVTAATPVAGLADRPVHEYVGTKTCRKCHSKVHRSIQESPKADVWELLQAGSHASEKLAVGLNPKMDYSTDSRCLPCHTVGFGHSGGYVIPLPGDDKAERDARVRQGVGCESCHGPGSSFIKVMKNVRREKREYTRDELFAAGLRRIDQQTCNACHNGRAMCVVGGDGGDLGKAQVELSNRDGYHAETTLKYRKR